MAEVEIGLARVLGGERPSPEVVDGGCGHRGAVVTGELEAPAEVDFLHVGEELRVKTSGVKVELTAHHQAGPRCPENIHWLVVLPVVFLAGCEDTAPAIWIAVAVDESSAGTGVFESIRLLQT